jgi:hypothetical protein
VGSINAEAEDRLTSRQPANVEAPYSQAGASRITPWPAIRVFAIKRERFIDGGRRRKFVERGRGKMTEQAPIQRESATGAMM